MLEKERLSNGGVIVIASGCSAGGKAEEKGHHQPAVRVTGTAAPQRQQTA